MLRGLGGSLCIYSICENTRLLFNSVYEMYASNKVWLERKLAVMRPLNDTQPSVGSSVLGAHTPLSGARSTPVSLEVGMSSEDFTETSTRIAERGCGCHQSLPPWGPLQVPGPNLLFWISWDFLLSLCLMSRDRSLGNISTNDRLLAFLWILGFDKSVTYFVWSYIVDYGWVCT